MKAGHLSEYFTGVAAKYLSAVEADVSRSHQHEFNGTKDLIKIFGKATGRQKYPTKFIYLNDDDDPVIADDFVTWYDAREKHATRTEHRLYYPSTDVSQCAAEGDLLLIGLCPNKSVLVIVAESKSTISNQIQWLFGLKDLSHPGFSVRGELETSQDRLEFASRLILESIGIEVEVKADTYLDDMLKKFSGRFPTTRIFSSYARATLKDVNSIDDPDAAIMAWMEREEILFRTLERHLVADQLVKGFKADVDGFISYSLSVQNRRKSRVGFAFENHLEQILIENKLRYTRGAITENKAKADFLFPGQKEYHQSTFNPVNLTMLGVKSSCKDRWRQVLSEADKIDTKHLLTLETAISTGQTDEMKSKKLQLVVPSRLHASYTKNQQGWLLNVSAFTKLVQQRQVASPKLGNG